MPPGSAASLPIGSVCNMQPTFCAIARQSRLSGFMDGLEAVLDPDRPGRCLSRPHGSTPSCRIGRQRARTGRCDATLRSLPIVVRGHRKDTRFCSGSCRTFHSQAKGEIINGQRAPAASSRRHLIYRTIWRRPGLTAPAEAQQELRPRRRCPRLCRAKGAGRTPRCRRPRQAHLREFLRRWLATLRDRAEHSPTTIAGYARCVEMAVREIGHCRSKGSARAHLDDAYARLRKRGGRVQS